jgi:transposase-like protein
MKWPSWLKQSDRRKPASPPSLTQCPKCGKEMIRVEKFTMSGRDMRTYRCDHCREEHIVDFGTALWKAMSDANKTEE